MQNESIKNGEHVAVSSPAATMSNEFSLDFNKTGPTINQADGQSNENLSTLEPEWQGIVQQEANWVATDESEALDDFDEFEEGEEGSTAKESDDTQEPRLIEAYYGSYPEENEVVIGKDDRRKVPNTSLFPYRAIVQLAINARNGRRYIGTGWLVSPRTIITAGHCVYLHSAGGWASSIDVSPGMNGTSKPYGSCRATALRSVKGWVGSKDREYDYGAIILPTNCRMGSRTGIFNFAAYSNQSLHRKYVNICGYPGDKGGKTQWYRADRLSQVSARRLTYLIDTAGGQSGAPIFFRLRNGKRISVGIHTSGSQSGNSGTRITTSVRANLTNWANEGR